MGANGQPGGLCALAGRCPRSAALPSSAPAISPAAERTRPLEMETAERERMQEALREARNLIARPYRADALSDAIQQCLAQAGRGTRTA